MSKSLNLEAAIHCRTCQHRSDHVEEYTFDRNFEPDEIVLIQCTNHQTACTQKTWFYCRTCKKRYNKDCLSRHSASRYHKTRHNERYSSASSAHLSEIPPQLPKGNNDVVTSESISNNECSTGAMEVSQSLETDFDLEMLDHHDNQKELEESVLDLFEDNEFLQKIGEEASKPSPSLPNHGSLGSTNAGLATCKFLPLNIRGNEWLQEALRQKRTATSAEVHEALAGPELENMKFFWNAENSSGNGKCGGGVLYLVARAFQQKNANQMNHDKGVYPSIDEALFQFDSMIQFQSMNEKQRLRQGRINKVLWEFQDRTFFRRTHMPQFQDLNRYYGPGQHSMWTNLPIPKAVDVGGVAYVCPMHIMAFVMANAVPIDDIKITADSSFEFGTGPVEHISQCSTAIEWQKSIKEKYYGKESDNQMDVQPTDSTGENYAEAGAPFSNRDTSYMHPVVIGIAVCDWSDGFGAGKVKNNRNPIDLKTFTISPPKHLVNTTDNTFPVAVGLKKAAGWEEVSRRFNRTLEQMTNSKEPLLFYNGAVQKIVPIEIKRMAVLSDKQERNILTGTIGCGSDTHRCFGISGKIQTPSCDVNSIKEYLSGQEKGKKPKFGWCEDFIKSTVPIRNGSIFPACNMCRVSTLRDLGVRNTDDDPFNEQEPAACNQCTNWELLGKNDANPSLDYPVNKSYPQTIAEGAPVPAPEGRDRFGEGIQLPILPITFESMKAACKFAFYQSCQDKGAWTQAEAVDYLKNCGVSEALAKNLHKLAKASRKSVQVSYDDPYCIGEFEFPGTWNGIPLKYYIEAIMHLLFLGISKSNLELIMVWMKSTPASAKVGEAPFLAMMQEFIGDIRKFGLSWLAAYPLTGKKGSLGWGSWVAENWNFFTRTSQFLFGWCARDYATTAKHGVDDMSRMVIAYHAMVARLLTHGGITEEYVRETELYMKEFLSALREFDIRVRHHLLNCKSDKGNKNQEAWWMKPNYMSLTNLLVMFFILGPLTAWWDGGGKGEKFIQEVKPHIKRGVREEVGQFFINLLEKLYRFLQVELLEKRYGRAGGSKDEEEQEESPMNSFLQSMTETIIEMVNLLSAGDDSVGDDSDEEDESDVAGEQEGGEALQGRPEDIPSEDIPSGDNHEDEFCLPNDGSVDDTTFTQNELRGMWKKKTVYIYPSEVAVKEALSSTKPMAGMVVLTEDDESTGFEFQIVFRKPKKLFGRFVLNFNDQKGIMFHGQWCADLSLGAELDTIEGLSNVISMAKMAAVALPLKYVVDNRDKEGKGKKYCVVTNWWKVRMRNGRYNLPRLDHTLYKSLYKSRKWKRTEQGRKKARADVGERPQTGWI